MQRREFRFSARRPLEYVSNALEETSVQRLIWISLQRDQLKFSLTHCLILCRSAGNANLFGAQNLSATMLIFIDSRDNRFSARRWMQYLPHSAERIICKTCWIEILFRAPHCNWIQMALLNLISAGWIGFWNSWLSWISVERDQIKFYSPDRFKYWRSAVKCNFIPRAIWKFNSALRGEIFFRARE